MVEKNKVCRETYEVMWYSSDVLDVSPLLTHLVFQDPVPPEVLSLLLRSDNPLLQQIFSDKDTKNQASKELSKVTVVSKFKVGAITCFANRFAQLWQYYRNWCLIRSKVCWCWISDCEGVWGCVRGETGRVVMAHCEGVIVELSGEPDEDPPQHDSSLHPLHQTQPRQQTNDFPDGGGRYSPHFNATAGHHILMEGGWQVMSQLKACGIVETVHISAAEFPVRSLCCLVYSECFPLFLSLLWQVFPVLQDSFQRLPAALRNNYQILKLQISKRLCW